MNKDYQDKLEVANRLLRPFLDEGIDDALVIEKLEGIGFRRICNNGYVYSGKHVKIRYDYFGINSFNVTLEDNKKESSSEARKVLSKIINAIEDL